jgi:hypothetical protein
VDAVAMSAVGGRVVSFVTSVVVVKSVGDGDWISTLVVSVTVLCVEIDV